MSTVFWFIAFIVAYIFFVGIVVVFFKGATMIARAEEGEEYYREY